MTIITAIIIFIFGTAIGSFLSVVIYRVNQRKDGIVLSRSFCTSCMKKIKWHHLIPVISWLFLKGKCAYCGKKISSYYLLLEILAGSLFLIAFLKWNFIELIPSTIDSSFIDYAINWEIFKIFVFYIIEFSLLLVIFFYDLKYKEIPDRFSIPAIIVALLGGLIFGIPDLKSMLLGSASIFSFFLLQFLLSRGAWLGGGDLRLGVLMGFLLGWEKGLLALILAYLTGGIFSIYLLATGKVKRKSTIPFGPFLVTATLISLFFGEKILNWYFTTLLL